jgi:hypothetical protein
VISLKKPTEYTDEPIFYTDGPRVKDILEKRRQEEEQNHRDRNEHRSKQVQIPCPLRTDWWMLE